MFEEIHDNREQICLDIKKVERFAEKFPGVTAICKKGGIPIEDGFIPVAPGAHFTMGGIITDENGATTVDGLYAIGECANTGVHGANRLASNSLLEGAVFAKRSAAHILKNEPLKEKTLISPVLWLYEEEKKTENDILDEVSIKSTMDECAGICRSHERLKKGKDLLHMQNLKPFLLNKPISYIKRANMQMMAWLTVTSSLKRTESRGSHFRIDFKEPCRSWEQKKIIRSLTDDESSIVKKTAAGIFN
jgi:L-aspartate oxidase